MAVSFEEYLEKEREFIGRNDALCENSQPHLCDCTICPVKDLCEWLHRNSPYKYSSARKEI